MYGILGFNQMSFTGPQQLANYAYNDSLSQHRQSIVL